MILSTIFSIIACVDPFEIEYKIDTAVVIIEAVLSDEEGNQFVLLKESRNSPSGKSTLIKPIQKAKVEIIVDQTTKIVYPEVKTDPGSYLAPNGFKAEPNKTYQLAVTLETGEIFTSKIEKLIKGSEIKKVYQQLEIKGKAGDKNYKVNHKIFLDTQDIPNTNNYYLWEWQLYEAQDVCLTCEAGERYYPAPILGCIKDLPPALRGVIYDYECYGGCWEILHSTKINIMSDEFSKGNVIAARAIADVPIYRLNRGALLEVKQQSINEETYQYYKILSEQSDRSGGLADTPPVSLIGNISSKNNQIVAGYFRVTDESKYQHWVDRSDILGTDIKPVFLAGRTPNFEPASDDLLRPPLVECKNGYNRTNKKPIGWREFDN
ncbi:MAG: DUF4249 domain-containing protein [Bacteroidota bacterium]